jgi:ThiF family protein
VRLTAEQENAKTLAALLGIEEHDAAALLQLRIAVNFDSSAPGSAAVASHVLAMLGRTVQYAGQPDGGIFAAEIIIGPRVSATSAPTRLFVGQAGSDFLIRRQGPALDDVERDTHKALNVIAACYVAAAAMRAALGVTFPIQGGDEICLPWQKLLGVDSRLLSGPVKIGEAYLAGAGAVGNGFLYTLRYFDIRGTLFVSDPKGITDGGLNRCVLFSVSDVGHPKASRICEITQPYFANAILVPLDMTLSDARKVRGSHFLIERLVVGVDSRRARRSLQTEFPGEVFDASTTGATEVVLFFNRRLSDRACLSCIYPETDRERKHEENVADALGITVAEVESQYITESVAQKICSRYKGCKPGTLVGRAFDTVYKELCGVSKLMDAGGQQVLAPFSFVSVLAGAYLALELVIRIKDKALLERFNYWRASPWHSPNLQLRQTRFRDPRCEFCSKPYFRRAMEEAWGLARPT